MTLPASGDGVAIRPERGRDLRLDVRSEESGLVRRIPNASISETSGRGPDGRRSRGHA